MARVRQERAEITRQAILDGAAVAFDRAGFGGTSLSDVVKRAGVTKGALYFHFPSKEALARTLIDEQFQVSKDVPTLEDPGLQTVIDLTHQMAFGLRTNARIRAGIRLVIEFGSFTSPDPSPYNAWIETCRSCLTPAQERGDILPSLDVQDLSTFLVGSFTGVQVTSHVRADREDLHARVVDLWNYLLPGIVPAPRIPLFDPAGSAACRAELGLPAPQAPVPVG
ncbi:MULTISPECIES: ScbR family autoregulator-binding transcription factor [Streptomyces]|uniref:ScbR family autoregulator-binding transcription factor n=1 Tax=Streptomyces TaxID=1883 RepID=UPI0021B074DF|nr:MULTISPECIES: ScbR family autoregulator-binding transcription factor [Streptomyces]GLX23139.1 gamma-butyrolactone-binding protein [Streptomyces lavendulae subsp. lavendulae]GLX30601.1 gamma-butyrolactone-binding protein [Streptomyces lavendulae subsp. lavendulae]